MTVRTGDDPFAAQKALVERLDKSGWDLIVGDAFVRGMRDIGYKSTSYALAELIDNSVQANATWADVVFGFNKGGAKPAQIAVIDNGWGMVPDMVRASLVWGAGTRPNDRQGFGKYGYGLPSASVSQCLRVEVYSKTADGPWAASYLDIDEISQGLWTNNHKINTPKASTKEPPPFVEDHLKAANRWPLKNGTIVVWDKLDGTRLDYKTREALKDSLLSYLGVIYRNYLVDVPMTVDGAKVQPCDPLFLTPGFRQDLLPSQLAALVEHLHKSENVLKVDIARYIGVSPATLRNYTGLWRLMERGGLFARIVELMDVGVFPASNPYAWLRLTDEGLERVMRENFVKGDEIDAWIAAVCDAVRLGSPERYPLKYVEMVTAALPAECFRVGEDVRAIKRDLGLRRAVGRAKQKGFKEARSHLTRVCKESKDPVLVTAAKSFQEYLS